MRGGGARVVKAMARGMPLLAIHPTPRPYSTPKTWFPFPPPPAGLVSFAGSLICLSSMVATMGLGLFRRWRLDSFAHPPAGCLRGLPEFVCVGGSRKTAVGARLYMR